jgi:aryl-phospho-beta-D-glucosidase BglC (GH1 family)
LLNYNIDQGREDETVIHNFIQTKGSNFVLNGEKIILRGWALGSWMNFEHFMLGMPGTNSMIIEAFEEVYGKERSTEFFSRMNEEMISENDIRYLKNIGINSIRIPFGYHWFMSDEKPFEFLEDGFQKLNRVVELCEKNELYIILDLHSTPGSQNTDWHSDNITGQPLFWKYRCFQDQVIWLWKEISKRYADDSWIIGYDIINEPGYGLTGEQINGFYDRAITAIRENDPNHILFLEGIDFGRDFAPLKEFDDDQIAYTVHFYPFVIEDNILDVNMNDSRRMEIFTEIFDRQIGNIQKFQRPIWCGESGYEILDEQEDFYSKLLLHNIDICESRGVSWNLWTYKDARVMGIVIPTRESRWIQLCHKIGTRWSHHREEEISMKVTRNIGEQYYEPLSNKLAYDMDFRIRSVLHRIAVEQILKPVLQEIPWTEMKLYPEDFLFEHCDQRGTVVEDIMNYIKDKQKV